MRKAKNDPGLQVGDKIRHYYTWIDENGDSQTAPLGDIETVTKVNSRFFYTEEKEADGCTKKTCDSWNCADFQKDGDIWTVTINLGKLPAKAANE